MADALAERLRDFKELTITQEVKANGVFARMPKEIIPAIQKDYFFHIWDEATHEVRLMCSWDTTEADIEGFAQALKKALGN